MALLDSEVERIRAELGYQILTVGAEPYVGFFSVFTQVVQPYVSAGAATTSSTAVTAADTPTPVTLTLASGTGFATGNRIVVDVDSRQEIATAQLVSGTSLTLMLSLQHSGTYPVTVEGGETIVREYLKRIYDTKAEMAQEFGTGLLKKVDELEWYNSGDTTFGLLGKQLMFWREELASAIGVESAWARRRAGAQQLSVY